jgi:hypothetical protein
VSKLHLKLLYQLKVLKDRRVYALEQNKAPQLVIGLGRRTSINFSSLRICSGGGKEDAKRIGF